MFGYLGTAKSRGGNAQLARAAARREATDGPIKEIKETAMLGESRFNFSYARSVGPSWQPAVSG